MTLSARDELAAALPRALARGSRQEPTIARCAASAARAQASAQRAVETWRAGRNVHPQILLTSPIYEPTVQAQFSNSPLFGFGAQGGTVVSSVTLTLGLFTPPNNEPPGSKTFTLTSKQWHDVAQAAIDGASPNETPRVYYRVNQCQVGHVRCIDTAPVLGLKSGGMKPYVLLGTTDKGGCSIGRDAGAPNEAWWLAAAVGIVAGVARRRRCARL